MEVVVYSIHSFYRTRCTSTSREIKCIFLSMRGSLFVVLLRLWDWTGRLVLLFGRSFGRWIQSLKVR